MHRAWTRPRAAGVFPADAGCGVLLRVLVAPPLAHFVETVTLEPANPPPTAMRRERDVPRVGATGKTARWRALLRALAIVAAAFAAALASANVIVLREGGRAIRDAPRCEADAIVVLGAGVHEDGTPSEVLTDRLIVAEGLHRAGCAPLLLVSGDHRRSDYDEPRAMRRWLERHGVDRAAIVEDGLGIDTYSTVWRAANVFHLRRVVIVTQRFHLARALFVAGRVGLLAEGVPADRRAYRGASFFAAREIISRAKALLDTWRGRRANGARW